MTRTHLITGVTGQDGILLARHLSGLDGRVVGTIRPGSPRARARAAVYLPGVDVVEHDIRDTDGFRTILERHAPAQVYNLAAISSVGASWERPEEAEEINGAAVAGMLDVLDDHPAIRFLQAGSAEQDGPAASPYSSAKSAAQQHVTAARERGLFACVALLHIHESPVRHPGFVVRKITRAAAAIRMGVQEELTLGSLDVRRDWGAAVDTVRAFPAMLALDAPADLQVATGTIHSLHDVLDCAFAAAGLGDPDRFVRQDRGLTRPADAALLQGDPTPLREATGWEPRWTFEEMVAHMVRTDLQRLESGIAESSSYLPAERGPR
ncbi:MAG TPA: GDP-mannose 4,6-dehydratase [Marmoricola sp.]